MLFRVHVSRHPRTSYRSSAATRGVVAIIANTTKEIIMSNEINPGDVFTAREIPGSSVLILSLDGDSADVLTHVPGQDMADRRLNVQQILTELTRMETKS